MYILQFIIKFHVHWNMASCVLGCRKCFQPPKTTCHLKVVNTLQSRVFKKMKVILTNLMVQ